MLHLTLLSLLLATTFAEKYHKVPQSDGSFSLLSETEFNQLKYEEEINPFYVAESDVIYQLYTRRNTQEVQIIRPNDKHSLKNSSFNPENPTRVVVHGWGDGNPPFFKQSKDEYLWKGDYNVILVDWSAGSMTVNYASARLRVSKTGIAIGEFVKFLIRNRGASLDQFILMGHSLGAHVVGNAGKHLNGNLPMILGTDPAGPLFSLADSDRLSSADANYVEVMHTNTLQAGITSFIGDADIYVNGGARQPGCGLDPTGACSHSRAPQLFVEGINSERGFIANKCKNLESLNSTGCDVDGGIQKRLGGEPLQPGYGVYFLETNGDYPFARA